MAVKDQNLKILEKAFSQFNASSFTLAETYRALKEEVADLKAQLRESQIEKEQLQEEAERNHRLALVGEMSARMAHELRNPLGSIELFSALLQKEITRHTDDPEKQSWGKHLSSAVKTMDHTITNLLFYTCKPDPEYQAVNIDEMLAELLAFVEHLLQQQRIEVIVITDPNSGPIWCDEDLLRQAILNLIINAIDAIPETGQLTLKAHTTQKDGKTEYLIQVSDTGQGIASHDLKKIFDPFFTTKKTGTGLGLAIAQNAITAHQGTIRVESKSQQGTCFTICIPQTKERD